MQHLTNQALLNSFAECVENNAVTADADDHTDRQDRRFPRNEPEHLCVSDGDGVIHRKQSCCVHSSSTDSQNLDSERESADSSGMLFSELITEHLKENRDSEEDQGQVRDRVNSE